MPERIAAAACLDGCLVLTLPRPARHHDILHTMYDAGLDPNVAKQGFLTSEGRFVDRMLACTLAQRAGQIVKKHGPDNELFSEDMW